jgi:hypothetical protein
MTFEAGWKPALRVQRESRAGFQPATLRRCSFIAFVALLICAISVGAVAQQPVVGPEAVSGLLSLDESLLAGGSPAAAVARYGDGFLLVWSGRGAGGDPRIFIARLDGSGQQIASSVRELPVTDDSGGVFAANPAIASDGVNALVAWIEWRNVATYIVMTVGPTLAPLRTPRPAESTRSPTAPPAVVWTGSSYLVGAARSVSRYSPAGDVVEIVAMSSSFTTMAAVGDTPIVIDSSSRTIPLPCPYHYCRPSPYFPPPPTEYRDIYSVTLRVPGAFPFTYEGGYLNRLSASIGASPAGLLAVWPWSDDKLPAPLAAKRFDTRGAPQGLLVAVDYASPPEARGPFGNPQVLSDGVRYLVVHQSATSSGDADEVRAVPVGLDGTVGQPIIVSIGGRRPFAVAAGAGRFFIGYELTSADRVTRRIAGRFITFPPARHRPAR